MSIVVCSDFEFYSPDAWCAAALLAVNSRTLKVLEHVEVGCRGRSTLSADRREFWVRNHLAKEYNDKLMDTYTPETAERMLVDAFERVRQQHPAFLLIGDNISLDVAHLDILLAKHGLPRSSFRPDNQYRQPVCTWSYRLSKPLFLKPHAAVSSTLRNVLSGLKAKYTPQGGEKHTPLFDCFDTTISFILYLGTNPESKLTKSLFSK